MINIDKNFGHWIPENQLYMFNVEYSDNLAYYIYCKYRKNRKLNNVTEQIHFIQHKKVYSEFYKLANLIIRVEKLIKIKNKNEKK